MMRRVGRNTGIRSWMVVSSETGAEPRIEDIGKHSVMRRTGLHVRDLRGIDPILSHPSSILVRERAIVVNLEHVKAIITATEVLMIHSSDPFFDSFLQDLLTSLTHQTPSPIINDMNDGYQANPPAMGREDSQNDSHTPIGPKPLPFEFRVLKTCIESACKCLESEASRLEEEAHTALDKLTSQPCTLNLGCVRHIKSHLVALSGRVQQVADELKHLLDDDNDLAEMHLTEKFTGLKLDELDVEELEILLETYFYQTNGILQRLVRLGEYVDDTEEDHIKIMIKYKENQLWQTTTIFRLLLFILSVGMVVIGYCLT